MEVSSLLNQVKKDPSLIDKILSPPGIHISDIEANELRVEVIPSGFPSLDRFKFLKKHRSELIVVGGRPSMGKSALMFQLAHQVSKERPVHVFSLEMDAAQVVTRIVSGVINKTIDAIQNGIVKDKEIEEAKTQLKNCQYIIDDRAGININQLCDAARQRHRKDKTELIIVDYLQMLRVEKGHSKDDEVGNLSRSLKELAKELKIPVIVASQLNRQSEFRSKEGTPRLSDLRDSGAIEQDADIVLLVHRESRYTGERQGEADLIIAKNRNGECGTIVMDYVASKTRFVDRESGI